MRTYHLEVSNPDGSTEQGDPFHMVKTIDDLRGYTLLAINPTGRPNVRYLHLRDKHGDEFPRVIARLELVHEFYLLDHIGRTF